MRRGALAVDAWLDSTLYEVGRRLGEGWRAYSDFMERFSARGVARVAADLSCEALTLGTAAGIVMLALAVPAFRETDKGDWLKQADLAVTFLDRYGEEIGKRGVRQDDSLRLDDYPDYFIKAVLATEDRRFYEHWGVDPIGTARALTVNARASGVVQGGSTITQQLAKNLFLSNERSLERKIKEAFLALFLETRLTKNEILKLYLDRVYMGGGNFGAAAAAEFYFGKSARDLTLAEAAMLAGLFKAPTRFAPHVNLPAARARANDVLTNMVDAGFLTDGQIASARRNPATPLDRRRDVSPDYYLDWAFDEIRKLTEAGKLGNERVLIVRTALDLAVQKSAETAIENSLRQFGPQWNARQSATVVMDPDGAVRAMVGGRDYGASQFNRATDAMRQPGSSFKPYVYTTALLSGQFKPTTVIVDAPVCIGNWCPSNYGHSFAGAVTIATALIKSINTIPVRLSIALGKGNAKIGRAKIIEVAKRMGLHDLRDSTSLPIGSAEVNILEHTAGYAPFANGGKRVAPYAAIEIRNSRGETVWRHDRDGVQPEQVLPPQVIADMNGMLNKVVEEGTARRARIEGVTVAGKTGTTNAYRDAWFVGYTGNYIAAVWMGNDDYQSMNRMTGGTLPAQTWHDMMEPIHRGIDLKPLLGVEPAVPKDGQAKPAGTPVAGGPVVRPGGLSRSGVEALNSIGDLFARAGQAHERADAGPSAPPSAAVANPAPAEVAVAAKPRAAVP